MKFSIKPTDPAKIETDVLILFSSKGGLAELTALSKPASEFVSQAASKESFEGSDDQILSLSVSNYIKAYKLLVVGLGEAENFDIYRLQKSVAKAIRAAWKVKAAKLAIVLPNFWIEKFTIRETSEAVVTASILSNYRFIKYKGQEEKVKEKEIEEVILFISPGKIAAGEDGVRIGQITALATVFARDLINEPADVTTPSYLAQTAEAIAKESEGKIKVKVFEKEAVQKLGMGAFLGVARGSSQPPKFIHLHYKPKRAKKKIVLIGKGITFDTGGLSLKAAEHMETMKHDMSGAASVLAVFKALPDIAPTIEVVGLIAACENMPSGSALRPGDILTALNGKTIEVVNTDAEGRLTLADALSFAVLKEKPDEIIDLATLTGACMVALGTEVAGLWGNSDEVLKEIEKSSSLTGERVWRMPLVSEYKELNKSHIADIKNIQTGRYGGAITGALFLSEFVGNIPWVHLDIAGPAYAEKDTPLAAIGGAGFGVRLLLHYLSL